MLLPRCRRTTTRCLHCTEHGGAGHRPSWTPRGEKWTRRPGPPAHLPAAGAWDRRGGGADLRTAPSAGRRPRPAGRLPRPRAGGLGCRDGHRRLRAAPDDAGQRGVDPPGGGAPVGPDRRRRRGRGAVRPHRTRHARHPGPARPAGPGALGGPRRGPGAGRRRPSPPRHGGGRRGGPADRAAPDPAVGAPRPAPAPARRVELPGSTFELFRASVEAHFRTHHDVGWYARSLGYAPRTVSRATQAAVGQTAKAYLVDRIVLEARRLLAYERCTSGRCASELGFSDASSFSLFFRTATGLRPGAWQQAWAPG